jgi:mannose/fructose/N-acetylgalactosamine-specific phosphotransferase system component IIC
VRVGTPFGEYPFEYRRVERRPDGVAIVGTVAGIESTVVLDRDDAKRAAKALAVPVAAAALVLLARRRIA